MRGDDPVRIVPYDPRWPRLFEEERARIESAIGEWMVEVEHIGSTAVPGLAAKPVIDIMVGVRGFEEDAPACVEALEGIGYECRREAGVPGRIFFRKFAEDVRTYHLHLVPAGGSFWREHLLFRDYLRSHPGAAREYERLKRDLAARFGHDRDAYTEAKTEFIRRIERGC